jgi:eukaryotic-like serine/threonine-protein kinase
MTGQLIGHYRILEKIGAGGMGEIFRARDERLGRDVAIKLIRASSSDNPDHLRRFEQEARAAAALNHPNIVAIFDVGFDGTTPYIVSELLEGKNLRQRLMAGAIPMREAADYGVQIAHGLTAAHNRHIVHRDLKPENLFITHDGRVKILDFGVAKLQAPEDRSIENLTTVTKSGAVVGTVAYMSPEQLRAKSVDHRSDLFSLGAILYEMLTGHRAFRGETEVDTMTAVLREEPPEINLEQASIPVACRDVVRHCLEKDPENRFQSAKDLAFALQTLTGTSSGTIQLSRKLRNTRRILPWAIAAALVAAACVLTALLLRSWTATASFQRVTFELGTVFSARFVPGGQSIIYSSAWNGRPVQLFTTVAESLQTQPLNLTDATLLGISRTDELALVMHGQHTDHLESMNGMLATASLAGSSPREIMSDVRWADWNPEGNKLAIVRNIDGHTRLEYPIGTVLYQTAGWISYIRFSPQGDSIAFMDHPAQFDSRGSVCVTDLAGHVQTLAGPWASEQGVAWRPDGKEIWFSAVDKGNTVHMMAVTLAGKRRILLNSGQELAIQDVAADGRVLVSANSRRLEMGYSILGAREDTLLSWHDWTVAKDISPNHDFVIFEDSSEAAGSGYAVAMRRLDGSLPIRLGDGSAGGLSPDGKWAVSLSLAHPQRMTLLPIGPGQPRPVETGGLENIQNGWERFIGNGPQIMVNSNERGNGVRCYALPVTAGAKATALTPEGISCGPSSPDGKFIASDGPDSTIALYPVAGGAPRILAKTGTPFDPIQWSSDTVSLYGTHRGELPAKIYRLEIASGKETEIQQLRPAAPAGIVNVGPVFISRDGAHFAYSYCQILSTLYVISGLR